MNWLSKTAAKMALAFCLFAVVLQAFGQNSETSETPVVTPKFASIDPASANAKRITLLQSAITIKFDNVWLPQALLQIFDAHPLPLTQKSRATLATLEKKFAEADSVKAKEFADLKITGEYKNAPLRAVLNDLCRSWGHQWNTYWTVSDGMIDIGLLDTHNEGIFIPLMTPVIRVYDVTALTSAGDVSEKAEPPHPLVRLVLQAGLTNTVAMMISSQVAALKQQGGAEAAEYTSLEPSATLFTRDSKTLLVVRHNVLSQHAIETLLDELHFALGTAPGSN